MIIKMTSYLSLFLSLFFILILLIAIIIFILPKRSKKQIGIIKNTKERRRFELIDIFVSEDNIDPGFRNDYYLLEDLDNKKYYLVEPLESNARVFSEMYPGKDKKHYGYKICIAKSNEELIWSLRKIPENIQSLEIGAKGYFWIDKEFKKCPINKKHYISPASDSIMIKNKIEIPVPSSSIYNYNPKNDCSILDNCIYVRAIVEFE